MTGPIVKVTATRPLANGWHTDGTVTFSISSDYGPSASLTFEFQNAPSQKQAIQQAAERLNAAAQGFVAMARQYIQ